MNKELSDRVWKMLPKEFKEEVKRLYRIANSDVDQMIATIMLENVFGHHNLTSDAEGEEMLTCVKDQAVKLYNIANKAYAINGDKYYQGYMNAMIDLFGSKCLPDELNEDNFAKSEPKPAELKFKEGDRAIYCIPEKKRIKARVVNVRQRSGSTLFNTLFNYDIRLDDGRTANWVDEQWLLPDNDDQVRAVTKKASERFDKILAKDLRKEKRLRIATQLMAAMMSNPVMFNKSIPVEYEDIVHGSLEYADAIIEAVEKGGCQ